MHQQSIIAFLQLLGFHGPAGARQLSGPSELRAQRRLTPAAFKRAGARAASGLQGWSDRRAGVRRVHMLHIGKTGGTALAAALGALSGGGCRFILHGHDTRLSDVPQGDECILFVRDPVSRFTSGFCSRQRQGRPRYDYPWSAGEATAFAAFDTPNQLALALSSPEGERRAAAERAMDQIIHLGHYSSWFGASAELARHRPKILFVGSQERLDSDAAMLSTLLHVPIDLPRDDVSAHRTPSGSNRKLEAQAVANLRRWYAEDYALLRLLRAWFPNLPDYDRLGA